MSTRRLMAITTIPIIIKKVFHHADKPRSEEEKLWRERAARMTLDALGYCNLTQKKVRHNEAVRYARRWFRQMYEDVPDPRMVDNASGTFDFAGIRFVEVRDAVLASEPILFEDPKETENVSG